MWIGEEKRAAGNKLFYSNVLVGIKKLRLTHVAYRVAAAGANNLT